MLSIAKQNGERHAGYGNQKSESHDGIPKLKDLDITNNQSSRWQKMAKMPQQPPTSENMSDIDFNGVTLGVTEVRRD